MIDDYLRIKALIKDEAQRQYEQQIFKKAENVTLYAALNLQDIEIPLIAERMQLEEYQRTF